MRTLAFLLTMGLFLATSARAEDGYRLWLRYDRITDQQLLNDYQKTIRSWYVEGSSPTLSVAANELQIGLQGLIGVGESKVSEQSGLVVCRGSSALLSTWERKSELQNLSNEGFIITYSKLKNKRVIIITGNGDAGILYGVYHFLRLLQTQKSLDKLFIKSAPKIRLRMLNHWDNLDRTVERGYAGFSLWDWHKLPNYLDARYTDYARANASLGINATAITNVNANALVLTKDYLAKAAALAKVFRPYGLKIFLTARFSAPMEIGGLKTADPLDKEVRQWWKDKISEIYEYIPDFGGLLVKANSEGQPGPQNYGRSQADGANLLAEALEPHQGVVIWRAFVYDDKNHEDRAKQAYSEFKPLDGSFKANAFVQVKNGPIDFQPREPFHPLFGAMPKTPLMMEFQITQEYLGFSTHLVYLATLFKECLESDTYAKGAGSTVAKVIDGSLDHHEWSGMAGVANIGTDRNWCGHPFAQANWYSFGRLAWDHSLSAEQLAEEWIRMTFSNEEEVTKKLKEVMLGSRETCVNYMTPLGLHHIMGWSHHYGPGPWIKDKPRADWTSVYYHQADSLGIGFDRTATGSNALSQYQPAVQAYYGSLQSCPDRYLLWFHHRKWDDRVKSGETLWDALCHAYYRGVDSVRWMQSTWKSLEGKIDKDRFEQVTQLLAIQEQEAICWREACVLYFQTFSKRPLPAGLEKPKESLEYLMKLEYPYAPGIRPKW